MLVSQISINALDQIYRSMRVQILYLLPVCIRHQWSIPDSYWRVVWKNNRNQSHRDYPVHADAVPDWSEYCLQNKLCRYCISFQSNVPIISAFRLIIGVNWPHICCTWNTSYNEKYKILAEINNQRHKIRQISLTNCIFRFGKFSVRMYFSAEIV